MTNAGYSEGRSQSFHCIQTQKDINIPLRVDTTTGISFILLNDVIEVFGNVKHVLSEPKRFKPYPGEILDVVLEECGAVNEKLDIVVEKRNFAIEELDIAGADGNFAFSLLNLAGRVDHDVVDSAAITTHGISEIAVIDRPLSVVGPIETIESPIDATGSPIEVVEGPIGAFESLIEATGILTNQRNLHEPANMEELHKMQVQRFEEVISNQRTQVASLTDALSTGAGLIQTEIHRYRVSNSSTPRAASS
ncbi:hypothetical protein BGX20_009047 [Mortierella sp. AD010]|nr:hypothetical protein BGX20_009047 [Mortierella sp. AD010]